MPAIARAFEPEKIILFGSHAYGQPHRDSDVDVFVVLSRARWRGRRPSLAIRRQVSAGFPVDILVEEPGKVARRLQEGDSLLLEIVEKGRVMYEASHAARRNCKSVRGQVRLALGLLETKP